MPRAALTALLACLLALPSDAPAQGVSVLEKLRTLPIDSAPGTVRAYYSRGLHERAVRLQQGFAAAVDHYRSMLEGAPSLGVSAGLALLEKDHWNRAVRRPYGQPHIDVTAWPILLVILPASADDGSVADLWRTAGLVSKADLNRTLEVIGYHELGHSLNVQYLYVLAPGTTSLSVQWFDEFMATYFGQGYLWHTAGLDADPVRPELFHDSIATYRSLVQFEQQHSGYFQRSAAGYANYAWYQAQFAGRARAVFRRQGLDFVRRVRQELPWDRYASWRTDELLAWLDGIEPGFVEWAAALERGRR